MKTTTTIQTQRGICAFVSRRFEFLIVSWQLKWAEEDFNYWLSSIAHLLPETQERLIGQMRADIAQLRVQQAVLRNS